MALKLFGTAGQAKLFCPGTKGQWDRSSFIVPGQRDNGTSYKSSHGTGFWQALLSRPGAPTGQTWKKNCWKKGIFFPDYLKLKLKQQIFVMGSKRGSKRCTKRGFKMGFERGSKSFQKGFQKGFQTRFQKEFPGDSRKTKNKEKLRKILKKIFFEFFWFFFLDFLPWFCPGTSQERRVCPSIFAPVLVPGQKDSGTGKTFLSRDKGTTGQGNFFVPWKP